MEEGKREEGGIRDPRPSGDLVTVLHTTDRCAIAVARSMLESEGIRCHVKGEGLRDVTGLSYPTAVFEPDAWAVSLQVCEEYADDARALLAELR